MSAPSVRNPIDVVQVTQSVREQISRRSGGANLAQGFDTATRAQLPTTEGLQSIDRELDALGAELERGEPSQPSSTLRGRIGSRMRRQLYRFLWWQSERIQAIVAVERKRGHEERRVLDALLRSLEQINRESREAQQLALECQRQIHDADKRLRELESAQLKLQAAEIERNVHARAQLDAERASMRQELSELNQAVHTLNQQAAMEKIAELAQRLEAEIAHKQQLAARISELGIFTHQTRASLSIQDRRLGLFIEEARKKLPEAMSHKQMGGLVTDHAEHRYDSLYAAFEDAFRGTRAEIKSRHTVYLPLLRDHGIGSESMPLLDLGCGRGEWLELLSENGVEARGIDRNDEMVKRCEALGFAVTQADALPYLTGLPDGSLGAVTSFHMVEHMPFNEVMTLIDESLRVLKPGGLLVLETPNPQNIQVGAHTFYFDPTHLKPLPSAMLRFFVEARGFCDVYVAEMQPYSETVRFPEDGNIMAKRLNDYFYGPQDYAVIGRKP
jgi:ubiquinone/menaquinone biosynthesis C-methylase UbiE/predicted transcriptional regulator